MDRTAGAACFEYEYTHIAPYYHRHKYDGTITNGIIYPMTRTLYGKSVRQPIGGEFGFSGRLAARVSGEGCLGHGCGRALVLTSG